MAKIMVVILFFMLVRWSWPRFRFDQLMALGWKVMMPLAVLNFLPIPVLDGGLVAHLDTKGRVCTLLVDLRDGNPLGTRPRVDAARAIRAARARLPSSSSATSRIAVGSSRSWGAAKKAKRSSPSPPGASTSRCPGRRRPASGWPSSSAGRTPRRRRRRWRCRWPR